MHGNEHAPLLDRRRGWSSGQKITSSVYVSKEFLRNKCAFARFLWASRGDLQDFLKICYINRLVSTSTCMMHRLPACCRVETSPGKFSEVLYEQ